MKAGFLEKLIERLGRIGPEDVQNYFLRLAQEKGFLETVFNAIQEGIIVTDSKGRITYLNDAACGLFGLEAGEAIGKRLEERIGGLDWGSLTQSGGPVSHDMEIFYPQNRFINFYVVPLMMEQREPTLAGGGLSAVALAKADDSGQQITTTAEEVGHVIILRDITESRRTARRQLSRNVSTRSRYSPRALRTRSESAQLAPHPSAIDGAQLQSSTTKKSGPRTSD